MQGAIAAHARSRDGFRRLLTRHFERALETQGGLVRLLGTRRRNRTRGSIGWEITTPRQEHATPVSSQDLPASFKHGGGASVWKWGCSAQA